MERRGEEAIRRQRCRVPGFSRGASPCQCGFRSGARTAGIADASVAALRLKAEGCSRRADECNTLSVSRPGRTGIEVNTRSEVRDASHARVIHADQCVILARADKSELVAGRRPMRRAALSPRLDQQVCVVFTRLRPAVVARLNAVDLAVFRERHSAAIRRKRRLASLGETPCAGAVSTRRPDGTLGAKCKIVWIGDPTLTIWLTAAYEDNRQAVVRDTQVGEYRAVVVEKFR